MDKIKIQLVDMLSNITMPETINNNINIDENAKRTPKKILKYSGLVDKDIKPVTANCIFLK